MVFDQPPYIVSDVHYNSSAVFYLPFSSRGFVIILFVFEFFCIWFSALQTSDAGMLGIVTYEWSVGW